MKDGEGRMRILHTIGELKREIEAISDECPINEITLQYKITDGYGHIRIEEMAKK
jgi:hypothetical protein